MKEHEFKNKPETWNLKLRFETFNFQLSTLESKYAFLIALTNFGPS